MNYIEKFGLVIIIFLLSAISEIKFSEPYAVYAVGTVFVSALFMFLFGGE